MFFSDSMSNELLKNDMYKEYDGKLYILDGARGSDIFKGDDYYMIKRNDNNSITISIKTEILNFDDSESYDEAKVSDYEYNDFKLEYINYKWVFTTFPVIR